MYTVKNGNEWYKYKPLGLQIDKCEKCIFGTLISSIIIFFLIGPLLLFSEFSGLIQENPVVAAHIKLSLIIEKQVFVDPISHDLV
jgi:hypothetical protein